MTTKNKLVSMYVGGAGAILFLSTFISGIYIGGLSPTGSILGVLGFLSVAFTVYFGTLPPGQSDPKTMRRFCVGLETLICASTVATVALLNETLFPKGIVVFLAILTLAILLTTLRCRLVSGKEAGQSFNVNDGGMFSVAGTTGLGVHGKLLGTCYFIVVELSFWIAGGVAFAFCYYQTDGTKRGMFLCLFLGAVIAPAYLRLRISFWLKTLRALKIVPE